MGTNGDFEFFLLLIGLALAAIGGLVAAFLTRHEIWDVLLGYSMKTRH
jgi:hypothetical protein